MTLSFLGIGVGLVVRGLLNQSECTQDYTRPGGGHPEYQSCRDSAWTLIVVGCAFGGAFLLCCFLSCCAFMDFCCFKPCKRPEARRGYRAPKYTPRTPKQVQFPTIKYDTVGDGNRPLQTYAPFQPAAVQPPMFPAQAPSKHAAAGPVEMTKTQPQPPLKTFALSPMAAAPHDPTTKFQTSHALQPHPSSQPGNAPPTLSDLMQKSPLPTGRRRSQSTGGGLLAPPGGAAHAHSHSTDLSAAVAYIPAAHHVVNLHTHHDGHLRPSAHATTPTAPPRSTEPRTSAAPPAIPERPYSNTQPGMPRAK